MEQGMKDAGRAKAPCSVFDAATLQLDTLLIQARQLKLQVIGGPVMAEEDPRRVETIGIMKDLTRCALNLSEVISGCMGGKDCQERPTGEAGREVVTKLEGLRDTVRGIYTRFAEMDAELREGPHMLV